ncbi:hypothetical protein M4951_24490 [Blastopirellula sp. J2-11]|uniref:hypothetical protein n=1 Tax=Blastopirellula sp. J2-11 TaxID=2943192 RepID=UPI0021CA1869|nr:hypothetical protein [Blastopirellula sp. J2-11]UUO06492.1 hypothetical protein M4951_24490 [Blastopirellula sp. J2-11]
MISRIRLAWTYLTVLFVLSPAVILFAQDGEEEPAPGGGWVLNYILVSLFVTLGVMAVCYASNRHNEELRRKELRELQEKNKAG